MIIKRLMMGFYIYKMVDVIQINKESKIRITASLLVTSEFTFKTVIGRIKAKISISLQLMVRFHVKR